jgi:PIN domain nuclease of toxin-antitoxin system
MVMSYVTDTHALVWYMTNDPKLSQAARGIFESADEVQASIVIPCIIFFELLYLIEKKRIAVDFDTFVTMVSSSKNYRIEPLCVPIIEKARTTPVETIADPWDRLIAATSMHLNVPLITRDEALSTIEGVEVIW